MKAITLLYHDVVKNNDYQSSGFQSSDADYYKLDENEFIAQLDAIKAKYSYKAEDLTLLHKNEQNDIAFYITFDDGGSSFLTTIASLLEARGWLGIFFISTDYIGTPGFLIKEEIVELRKRGHVIGSHSCSHPKRISSCSYQELINEWKKSKEKLEIILGEEVETASVPGGFLSKDIEHSAAEVGYKSLFTSEPQKTIYEIDGCQIVGRYAVTRGTSATQVLALASKSLTIAQIWQYAYWNLKKFAKNNFSSLYARFRLRMRR
ncbi:hypothetical protein FGD67_09515 [Colwellia sp. M166]|uniref:polysaccharide deacetylase family protein n=1 Tax=Colwellia sp. M166 TaxID=2583805 RepID=UPI00211EFDE0|nr:polysaccharide deacetylase family protein [Colwellia sp. M166]UUO23434.1 hypothetical protein FGD67_09515 [Colwellia sp. M166]|tara:strand:- start:4169 stop:4957 length:789 start_codon:yes stop_codon:yes gene_type:complete